MRGVAIVWLLAAACVQSNSVVCDDGRVCPIGTVCDPKQPRCLGADQLEQCANQADGTSCQVDGVTAECRAGVCEALFCGDGIKSPGEQCDGDDLGGATCITEHYYESVTGLACRADCTFDHQGCAGSCGDGILNGDEQCDGTDIGTSTCVSAGFYSPEGLACSAFCRWDVAACVGECGDGIMNGEEVCDTTPPGVACFDVGLDAGSVGCNGSCSYQLSPCFRFGFVATTNQGGDWNEINGSGSTDIWAAGANGSAMHFNGTKWSSVTTGSSARIVSVSTLGPTDAWFVDDSGGVYHWNGSMWTKNTSAPSDATAVWAQASNNVFVATLGNGVQQWNGTQWSVTNLIVSGSTKVHGSGAGYIVAASPTGELAYWNGSSQVDATPLPIPPGLVTLIDMYVVGPSNVYVLGLDSGDQTMIARWDGISWTLTFIGPQGYDITATSRDDVWVSTRSGSAYHWDGSEWLLVPIQNSAIYAAGASNVVAIDPTGVVREFRGISYASNPLAVPNLSPVSVWSTESQWIVGLNNGSIARYDGTSWSTVSAATAPVDSLWGTSNVDMWAVGGTRVLHLEDDGTWTSMVPSNTTGLHAIWGVGGEIWAGGSLGTVLHYDGTWTNRNIPGVTSTHFVSRMSGSGPNDVWAYLTPVTSVPGRLFHWTGTWTEITLPGGAAPRAVVSIGPGQAIVVSSSGAYHGDGTTWTQYSMPAGVVVNDLVASGRDVIGTNGIDLVHFDGTGWWRMRAPFTGARALSLRAGQLDVLNVSATSAQIYMQIRTRPMVCDLSETNQCGDGVDNDCDGRMDELDSDCP